MRHTGYFAATDGPLTSLVASPQGCGASFVSRSRKWYASPASANPAGARSLGHG
jgi:hypothetical protein